MALLLSILALGFIGLPYWGWLELGGLLLFIAKAPLFVWIIAGSMGAIASSPFLRRPLLTQPIVQLIQRFHWLPQISETERSAIEAGTVWVEREFFSVPPNLDRLLDEPYPQMSEDLHRFLDGPVEQVCRMVSDWEIYQHQDLPAEVWQYLKQERFFGIMIPKEYGGLGLTSTAYSAVMSKLASRSFTHVATVGVTNSLGPAKLILRYGTDEQKQTYLPRLARGEEIPCSALPEPLAGSAADSLTSLGYVSRGDYPPFYISLPRSTRYII